MRIKDFYHVSVKLQISKYEHHLQILTRERTEGSNKVLKPMAAKQHSSAQNECLIFY